MVSDKRVVHYNNCVRPKARRSIHKAVLDWFETQRRGLVLDAPAGYGHLSLKLKQKNFDVVAGEIEPEIFAVPDMECVYVDLNRQIKTPDNTYDYVCCVDGLEHMTDPYQAVRELARVLKPGGYGVFSIPNYTNIEKRLKFLFSGYLTKPVSYGRFHVAGGNLFNFHNSPLTITILEFMFKINNLDIVEIRENAPKVKQYLLLSFVMLLWLAELFRTTKSKKKHRTDLTLKKSVILGGNNLIIITRKSCIGQEKGQA